MATLCKILFISAPVGAGHIKAAQAVSSALCAKSDSIETKIANVFDFFNPYIGQAILKIYLKILKMFPGLYGMAYSWGNESYLALVGRKIISGYLASRMEKYIMEYNPVAIVCTHATPAGLVAHLVKKNKINIPVIAVVTDFVVHRLWVYPEIKNYVVANQDMSEFLNKNGIGESSIAVLGIPVDKKFSKVSNAEDILKKLGFDSQRKTILIMGGGAGMLPMDEIVRCCEDIDLELQIIVVAGHNQNIYQKLMKLQPTLRQKVRILGYVDNVSELMEISDLIISKPGGVTTAETLCLGLPMIIYRPIPGQEEGNTHYLTKCQAALRADSLTEIQGMIKNLFIEEPEKLLALQQNALQLGRPQSAQQVADIILSKV